MGVHGTFGPGWWNPVCGTILWCPSWRKSCRTQGGSAASFLTPRMLFLSLVATAFCVPPDDSLSWEHGHQLLSLFLKEMPAERTRAALPLSAERSFIQNEQSQGRKLTGPAWLLALCHMATGQSLFKQQRRRERCWSVRSNKHYTFS